MSAWICSPVIPLYNNWFPLELYPFCVNIFPNCSCFDPLLTNAVQSPYPPVFTQALPINVSTNWPIVILDGNACGFTIISGRMPSSVKGIFSSGITNPTVPFWPQRLQNLSPIAGILSSRILTFARRNPSSSSVINVLSTNPNCPFFGYTDASMLIFGFAKFVWTLPMTTFLSSISVFSFTKPYLSRLL